MLTWGRFGSTVLSVDADVDLAADVDAHSAADVGLDDSLRYRVKVYDFR